MPCKVEILPGFDAPRLVGLMHAAIERCRLDLEGATLLTEAATGAYAVTPVLAAMAGAKKVYAIVGSSRHGTAREAAVATHGLATGAGVADRIEILESKSVAAIGGADIITNSGFVRPIDGEMIGRMKPTAVVSLMYEPWELRATDVDMAACRRGGIPVAGTNERHPAVDVFPFLGAMAARQLSDAGVTVRGSRLVLLCDNDFAPFIERGLADSGATVRSACEPDEIRDFDVVDAVVVALQPHPGRRLAARNFTRWQDAVIAQFWGDIERAPGLQVWPPEEPQPGHMGILPSAVGPEPVVRLQSGGLKVGEVLWRARSAGRDAIAAAVESGYGLALETKLPG